MSPMVGWALAAAALVAGYVGYGWPGVLLGLSVVLFWLLLQFSRTMQLMRKTAQRPMGSVGKLGSVLMLQTRLQHGMRLAGVMQLAGSFGKPVSPTDGAPAPPDTEVYAWADAGGDALQVTLVSGKVSAWEIKRAVAAEPGA